MKKGLACMWSMRVGFLRSSCFLMELDTLYDLLTPATRNESRKPLIYCTKDECVLHEVVLFCSKVTGQNRISKRGEGSFLHI